MSFENALRSTLAIEGLWSDDPSDPGGETYRGISRRHHPGWPGWAVVDSCRRSGLPLECRELLSGMVNIFYHDKFWLGACQKVHTLSSLIAEELFEASVNCGKGNGAMFLQRALNELNVNGTLYPDIEVDGVIGDRETIPALKKCLELAGAERLIFRCQNGEQYAYYKSLPQRERFRGWYART